MTTYSIRPATVDDAPQINAHRKRVSEESYNGTSWSTGEYQRTDDEQREAIEKALAQDNTLMLVAEADAQIIGLAAAWGGVRWASRHVVGIGIDVHADWRNKGVGTALMRGLLDWARANPIIHRVELEVLTNNPRALHVYEKLGFVVEGRRRDAFFKDGVFVDILVMSLLLGEAQAAPVDYTSGPIPDELDTKYPRNVYETLANYHAEEGWFIRVMVSELRTPLATIKGYTQLWLEYFPDGEFTEEEKREFLEQILQITERELESINTFQRLTELKTNQLKLHSEVLAFQSVVEEVWSFQSAFDSKPLSELIDAKKQIIKINLAGNEAQILADRGQLVHALAEIILNAHHYTPPGGEISIESAVEGDMLHVTIADTGTGIPPEELPHVYDMFWRGQQAQEHFSSHDGLGLTIARGLIERMRGRIWIESEVGVGTRVHLLLPLAKSS